MAKLLGPVAFLAIFTISTASIINFCLWPHPYSVAKISPEFQVFTHTGSYNFTIQDLNQVNGSIKILDQQGFFALGRQVVFLVHGYRDVIDTSYIVDIKNALLELGDFTVFLTGWEKGAYLNPLEYAQAASNVQTVGDVIASLSKAILDVDVFNGDPDQLYLYCIGHSLGAHVCGQAGLQSPGLFDRITGLDAAGPGFENCHKHPSLLPQSAQCVDAIHTDGNFTGHVDFVVPHLGSLRTWGFIDFYPNGGVDQPGCSVWENDSKGCSHHRSVLLFVDNLRNAQGKCQAKGPCKSNEKLPDTSCDQGGQQQPMGYYSDCYSGVAKEKRRGGVFYLSTAKNAPYC